MHIHKMKQQSAIKQLMETCNCFFKYGMAIWHDLQYHNIVIVSKMKTIWSPIQSEELPQVQ